MVNEFYEVVNVKDGKELVVEVDGERVITMVKNIDTSPKKPSTFPMISLKEEWKSKWREDWQVFVFPMMYANIYFGKKNNIGRFRCFLRIHRRKR